jgi:tetratricopeptide (TPR) repeat protein
MFTVLKSSTADLIASSAESLSVPMILLAATVARQQKKWDLAENLAVTLVRKTKGHRDFYELCSLLTLGGLKVNIHQECSEEAEAMIRKSIEIANHLPVRPQIEMLKVEAYTMLTKMLANTDRSEEAIEPAKSLERIVGKNREKCPSLVWDYSLNHTRRGFAYRVEWLHTTAVWLEKAGEYTTAADFTAQAIDIFNESGSEPNSDIIDLYNTQLLALYRGGNYEKLLTTCDKHLQIFRKFGSGALDIHTGWKIQTLRSVAYASKGDIREAEKCSCEAADEVHRLGVKKVQPQYELWLIDMMKDLAHIGQYDRSLTMCRELLKIKQCVSTKKKNPEQDTMFIKLQPLVCKLENAGLIDHDYQQFLRCYSFFFLLEDQQDTSQEADWWESQASMAHEDVPLFEQKASLLALKHVETFLRHDSDLNRAISGYKSLTKTQFEQGDLEAAILVSYDAASRLLADFTLDPSTSYIEISEISLSGGDVLKSKSWLVLAYETQRESTSDARQVFGIEVYFASLYAYMVEAYEEQIESADMRESFIEQACEHLSRAIEED